VGLRGAIAIATAATVALAAAYTTDFGGPLEPEAERSRADSNMVELASAAGAR